MRYTISSDMNTPLFPAPSVRLTPSDGALLFGGSMGTTIEEDGIGWVYHVDCCKCGYDWWTRNAFPDKCPNCGKNPSYGESTDKRREDTGEMEQD